MDPFSITVGAIGVADIAMTRIVDLHNLIDHLAGVKREVQDIYSGLEAIQGPLRSLESSLISDEDTSTAAKEDLKKTGVAEAVNRCGEACESFGKSLQKWTKHSTDTRVSLRDRLTVGIWNKEKIATFQAQVQSCQATVHFAVTTAQLHIQLRSEKNSAAARSDIIQRLCTLQDGIQQHLESTNKQQEQTRHRLQELSIEPDDEEDDGVQRMAALREAERRSVVLEADQVSSGITYAQVRSHITQQSIEDIATSSNSTALVGLPQAVVGKINQRIKGVTTTDRSKAVVGVFSDTVNARDYL